MTRLRLGHCVACVILASFALASHAGAQDAPRWPSENAQRLKDLDAYVLDIQRRLSAARHRNDSNVDELKREFEGVRKERRELLRATHQLPY